MSGIGPKRIADALNKDGFRNKKHYNPDGTFRNGGRKFTEKHIHNFITNCLYCGRIHFKGEMLPGNHDAIISEKDWNDAQEVVALNRDKRNLGNTKRDQFVLAGLLTCGICGDIVSATAGTGKQKKKYTYYQCLSARAPEGKRNDCNFQSIPTEQLENVVAGMIKEIANTDGFLKAIEEEFIATSTAKELEGLKDDLKNTNRQISNTEIKIKNLIDVLAKGSLDDTTPIETELGTLNTLKKEKATFRESLVQEISQKESPTPNSDALMSIYKEFDELWETFSKTDRRTVLNLLIDGIEINYPKDSDKGEIILYLYNEPPIKSLYEIIEGSHVYLCKLRKVDKYVNSSELHISLTNIYNKQLVRPAIIQKSRPGYFHAFLPKTRFGLKRSELLVNRLTSADKRRQRAEQYQKLMMENGWSRAELARQLGVSRAWVTTVLNDSVMI